MDQKKAAFPYTTLDTTKSEIRLIYLHPGRVTDGIKCELILASLNDKSTYEALSYEWGPPCPDVFGIKLNGQEHFVRENLWLALRCLRLEDGPRTFWIDAICIDQSNIPERNHQVDQMGRIYSQALGVVAWIGLEKRDMMMPGNHVNLAQTFLHELSVDKNLHLSRRKIAKYEKDMRLDCQLALKVDALLELCHRTYWTRLWIIQELVLSHRGIIQCGSITFDLAIFRRLFQHGDIWWEFCRWADDTAAAKMWTSPTMSVFRLNGPNVVDQEPMALLEVMSRNSKAECEDARDKIFGLLNLCAQCCRTAIPPDYSRSLTEICKSVLEHHISHHTRGEFVRDIVTKDLFDAIGTQLWEIEPSQAPSKFKF